MSLENVPEQPENVPEQSPETLPGQSPETLPEQSPETVPEQSEQSSDNAPTKSQETVPEQSPETLPEQSPETLPEQSLETVPGQSEQSSHNAPTENIPGQSPEILAIPKPLKDFGTAEQWRQHFTKKRNERMQKKHLKPLPWTLSSWPGNKPKETILPKLAVHVEPLDTPATSLFWDEILQKLFFVVTETKTIFQYDPINGKKLKVQGNWAPRFIFPIMGQNNKYVMGLNSEMDLDGKVVEAEWTNSLVGIEKTLSELEKNILSAKTDPIGRIVLGCSGYLAVLEPPGKIRKIYPLEYCTDLAWNMNGSKMFVISSRIGQEDHNLTDTLEFKYDARTGEIQGQPTVKKLQGSPRCLTVDMSDRLWVGCTNSSDLIVLNTDSWTVHKVFSLTYLDKSIQTVTSITFGDFAMDVLFLTTLNESKPKSADEGDTERDKYGKEDVTAKGDNSVKEDAIAEIYKTDREDVIAERDNSGKEHIVSAEEAGSSYGTDGIAEGDMIEDQFDIEEQMVEDQIGIEEDMFDDHFGTEGDINESEFGIKGEMVEQQFGNEEEVVDDQFSIEEDINENEFRIKKHMESDKISNKEDRNDIHIEEYTEGNPFSNVGDSANSDNSEQDANERIAEDETSSDGDGKRSCVYRIRNVGARGLPDQRVMFMYYG